MDSTKPQLRKTLQEARMQLGEEARAAKSAAIAANLLQAINWPASRLVHCFEPIMHLGEVDLVDFVTALQTDESDVHVHTSRKIDGSWQVVSADTDKLVVPVPKFDVIIVPMLGFDKDLHRIGYGGGYYDRFLADQPQARKIGVCYEIGKLAALPHEAHDIPLDLIITEDHTYAPLTP